jgi:hypothetical protein
MSPALPIAFPSDPARAQALGLARTGGEPSRVPPVDAARATPRGQPWSAQRGHPDGRDETTPDARRWAAWRDQRAPVGSATSESRWGATLFLAQRLGQLEAATNAAGAAPSEARRPYDGPDPHAVGSAAYRRVGAEPPLYREAPVVFRFSV